MGRRRWGLKLVWSCGPLVAIVAIGAYLRLSALDLAAFKLDQATAYIMAADMLDRGVIPLVGMHSSVGTNNPPLFTYLMGLPLLVTRDPAALSAFVALLNLAGLVLTYFFVQRYLGRTAAVLTALLYAVNPWSVVYSRDIWCPSLLPPFTVAFFWSLARVVIDRRSRWLVGAVLALAALVQLHLSAVPYAFLMLAVLVGSPVPSRWRYFLTGVAFSLPLAAPFIYYEASQDFPSWRRAISVSGEPAVIDLTALDHSLREATSSIYTEISGNAYNTWIASIPNLGWLDDVLILVVLAGLSYALAQAVLGARHRDEPARRRGLMFLVLLIWFLTPVLFLSRHTSPVYAHYLILLQPVQFILIAALLERVCRLGARWRGRSARSRGIVTALAPAMVALFAGTVVVWQLFLFGRFFTMVTETVDTSYSVPLRYYEQVVREAQRLAPSGPVFLLSDGDRPAESTIPAVFTALRPRGTDLTILDGTRNLVFRDQPALYLLAPGAERAELLLAQLAAEEPGSAVRLPGTGQSFRFFQYAPRDWQSSPPPFARASFSLQDQVALLGFDAPGQARSGGKLTITIYWTVLATSGGEYTFFNHLIDDQGRLLAGADGLEYPVENWRVGDVVASWYDLKVPPDAVPGRYWLQSGMYARPSLKRLAVKSPDGSPVGDSARLGFIKIASAIETATQPAFPRPARLGGTVELLGFDSPPAGPLAGSLLLSWRLLRQTAVDYTVSIQAISDSGKLAAQVDRQPRNGRYPTSIWDVGERVDDVFDLPAPLPPGTYRLQVCLYDVNTLGRLKAEAGPGVEVVDDCVVLERVAIIR